jgi:hypothetical protein
MKDTTQDGRKEREKKKMGLFEKKGRGKEV